MQIKRGAVAGLVVLLGAGAWFAWWGQPRLGTGSLVGVGAGMTWANDGVEDTRMLVRGRTVGTVEATFSIRNDGHLPFTVRGLDTRGHSDWLSRQRVTFLHGLPGLPGSATTPAATVTLRPGEEATVNWSLPTACQPAMAANGFTQLTELTFRTSWFGLPGTRVLPLERPITFVGDITTGGETDACDR